MSRRIHLPAGLLLAFAVAAPVSGAIAARTISTAMGDQPTNDPQVRITAPVGAPAGRLRRGQPIVVRAYFSDFDNRPELRTANAGVSLGSLPQVVVDGRAQGHAHAYLQPILADGRLASTVPVSFCVLTDVTWRDGYESVAQGTCPAVEPGLYRLSVELQSNAHVGILKSGPQAVPSSDLVIVVVR